MTALLNHNIENNQICFRVADLGKYNNRILFKKKTQQIICTTTLMNYKGMLIQESRTRGKK